MLDRACQAAHVPYGPLWSIKFCLVDDTRLKNDTGTKLILLEIQLTTRTTEDGIPELTRIPEKIATTEHFILLAR